MTQIYNVKMFDQVTRLAKSYNYNIEIIGEPDYLRLSTKNAEITIQLKEDKIELCSFEAHYGFTSIKFSDDIAEFVVTTNIDGGLTEIRTRAYHNRLFMFADELEKFLRNPGYFVFERFGRYLPIDSEFYVQVKKLLTG